MCIRDSPVSIQVNGQWQTFPNAKAAEEASYEEYKACLLYTSPPIFISNPVTAAGTIPFTMPRP